MDRNVKTPCWVRGGRIEEIVYVGREVLAWCTGLYIVFFHIIKRQQTLRWCWNNATGDGARCISGHVSSPIFAFSERSLNPRIFVLAYPSMTKICECVEGCASGYLAIAFTSHDYLVSLGSYPDFPMIVWFWRTGEKIAIVDTPIRDEVGQIVRVTPAGRTVIGQMGKTCGALLVWELDVAGKIAILKNHEVKLPKEATKIHGIDWCPVSSDPLLAIVDLDGHIYLSNYDGTEVRRIVVSQRCGICMNVELPAVCWFRGGIILRTTFCQIRYFEREPKTDVWRKLWYVKSVYKPHVLVTHPLGDCLFYHTLEGHLMQIAFRENKGATPLIRRHLHSGGRYHFVDFLRPWCHHLAVTDDLKELTVLEAYSGSAISQVEFDIEGVVSAQAAHPEDPMIAVVSDQGEMVVLGVTDPERPMILAHFRLQRRPLDLVKFSHSGKYLIAAQKETGDCYCISLRRDGPWSVMARLRARKRLADVMLYDEEDVEARGSLRVLALQAKYERVSSVGQRFLVYDVSHDDRTMIVDEAGAVTLPALFRELCHAPGDNPRLLIGAPYLERQLHALRLQRDLKDATLTDAALTGHHVRLARVFADRRWIATCAHDGLVVVRDRTVWQIVAATPAHHRLDSGSRKAIVNPEGDTMVALGRDGSLVCIRHESKEESGDAASTIGTESVYPVDHDWYETQRQKILSDYASLEPAIRASLTRAREEFPAAGDNEETWEEWQQYEQLRRETMRYAAEKAAIAQDLTALKATVRQLLDANETRPEMERLPVSAFDLDLASREARLKAAEDERAEVRAELERLCASTASVADWIKATYWEPQIVLGRSIFSFRGDTEVTNYPLTEEDPYFKDHLRWAQFSRESTRGIIDGDTFQPWRAYTAEELRTELSKPVTVYREDDRRRMDVFLEEEEREIDPDELAEMRVFDGMTTHRFVEQSPYYYSQMESYGFAHVTLADRYLMHDCAKLQAHFNKLFDDMYAAKEQEMSVIRERNEKIRHIDSELRIMFGESVPRVPVDPRWHPKENVESIIQVSDDEVKARPYVSPSQQEILDWQAAEAERTKQLLLFDDFRERALMRMMDGVLEIRWEDIIKIEVRKPACMLEKQPEQYTPGDIAAVKKYEANVEILRQERERYKRMLEAEYAKTSGLLQDGVDKFDSKLDEFFQLKLKIEAAINQLKLRHIRGRMRNLARVEGAREDDRTKREMAEKCEYRSSLEEHLRRLQDVYENMLAQHEDLCAREKAITKRLHQEFAALSKINVQLLTRQFKRRPQVSLKNVAASDLANLAKYLTGDTSPTYLPTECADYSRILESLDARPGELPQSIDASHWDHLIQLRRQKIVTELRIRARQLEVAAVERTIGVLEGEADKSKSSVSLLRDRLKSARDKRMIGEQDTEMQLVLKRGQVELKLLGERQDTVDAVLVPRSEIERVNEHILAAGARKLNALKRLIDFRNGTLSIEWEHSCLRMRFKELDEDLRFVRDITATRDVRAHLKRRAKGLRDDKTVARLERKVEATRESLEKALSKEVDRLENLRQKIARVRKKNAQLDRTVTEMNVARWALEYQRDTAGETRRHEHTERKMRLLRQRSDLLRKLRDNYAELLALQSEHEMLRLRTYPALCDFETSDDKSQVC